MLLRWMLAFAITQLVECPIYVKLFRVRISVAFLASTITHPIVVFVFPWLVARAYLAIAKARPGFSLSDTAYFVAYGAVAETFAILFEAWFVARAAKLPPKRALLASIVANGSSGLAGLLCSWATGFP